MRRICLVVLLFGALSASAQPAPEPGVSLYEVKERLATHVASYLRAGQSANSKAMALMQAQGRRSPEAGGFLSAASAFERVAAEVRVLLGRVHVLELAMWAHGLAQEEDDIAIAETYIQDILQATEEEIGFTRSLLDGIEGTSATLFPSEASLFSRRAAALEEDLGALAAEVRRIRRL